MKNESYHNTEIFLLFIEMVISDTVFWSLPNLKKYPSVIYEIIFSLETQYHLRSRETMQVYRCTNV